MTSRNYMFTVHFADFDAALNARLMELPDRVGYMIWSIEQAPLTGAIHWQGYMELDDSLRIPAAKRLHELFATAHLEKRNGTQAQAIAYCSKEESHLAGPFELGVPAQAGRKRKSCLDEAIEAIKANPFITQRELDEQFSSATVRFNRALIDFRQRLRQTKVDDSTFIPYDWQQSILTTLQTTADDRHIIWVTDTIGGKGKSRLAHHLIHMYDACVLSGKLADMIYVWKNSLSRIAIFDVTRSAAEHSDHLYTMAEMLKNGAMCNSKYESCAFTFKPPHVLFFSNFSWDRSKWSNDRVIEIDLNAPVNIPPLPQIDDEFLDRFFSS